MKTQSLDALHRVAAARFDDYRRKLTKSRQEEWQRLSAQHPIFWHWIHHAFRVTEEQWSQDAEEWIRIYKEVSLSFGRPELLQNEQLNRLREDIMIRIEWACQGLEHQIQMAASAQSYTGELPGVSDYDVYIRGRVLNVVITRLELLEAEGEAARADEDNRAAPPPLCEQDDEVPGSQATSTRAPVRSALEETNSPEAEIQPEAERHQHAGPDAANDALLRAKPGPPQERATRPVTVVEEDDTGEPSQVTPEPAGESPKSDNDDIERRKAERKKLRDDYIAECKRAGVKVTDKMIAMAARPSTATNKGWNTRDSIQKWLQCDPKYDGTADRLIRDVFRKKPHLPKPNSTAHHP